MEDLLQNRSTVVYGKCKIVRRRRFDVGEGLALQLCTQKRTFQAQEIFRSDFPAQSKLWSENSSLPAEGLRILYQANVYLRHHPRVLLGRRTSVYTRPMSPEHAGF